MTRRRWPDFAVDDPWIWGLIFGATIGTTLGALIGNPNAGGAITLTLALWFSLLLRRAGRRQAGGCQDDRLPDG